MSSVLRIAVVEPNDSKREALKGVLLALETVWLEAECSRYEFFVDVVEQTKPEICLIGMDADPSRATALIHEVLVKCPQTSVLVCSSSTDGRLILDAMRAGAKEFLTEPVKSEDLSTSIQRIRRQSNVASGTVEVGGCNVISVAGATGGVGGSSVAVNLACALAADPKHSVVLIDLDLALGDADVFLDTIPEYTLADVSQNVERLDLTLLKKSLTKHSSGVHLLPRPLQLEDAQMITAEKLQRIIGLMKTSFSHIVLDLSKSFSRIDLAALRASDQILMITQLDLPCLRNVVRLMMTFDDDPEIRDKVRIVVNRFGQDSGQISLRKARETVGRDIYWQIPNDYRVMVEVRNNGVPLLEHAPKAPITQSIGQLADSLCGKAPSEDDAGGKGRRWLNLWPARA